MSEKRLSIKRPPQQIDGPSARPSNFKRPRERLPARNVATDPRLARDNHSMPSNNQPLMSMATTSQHTSCNRRSAFPPFAPISPTMRLTGEVDTYDRPATPPLPPDLGADDQNSIETQGLPSPKRARIDTRHQWASLLDTSMQNFKAANKRKDFYKNEALRLKADLERAQEDKEKADGETAKIAEQRDEAVRKAGKVEEEMLRLHAEMDDTRTAAFEADRKARRNWELYIKEKQAHNATLEAIMDIGRRTTEERAVKVES